MAKYSKAHERDESSRMWRGFWHSTFGILLCWVPGLGLILSISGFCRQVVRMTEKHRVRMAMLILYGLVSLCVSIGAILGGLYAYSRDPQVFVKYATMGWQKLTGQTALPGQLATNDYAGNLNPGLGVLTDGASTGPADEAPLTDEEMALAPEGDAALSPDDMLGLGDEDPEGAAILDGSEEGDEALLGDDEALMGDEEGIDIATDDGTGAVDLLAEDDIPTLDFFYAIDSNVEAPAENGLTRVEYKVVIDKYDPTDDDLVNMFKDAVYEDGYDLHTLYVYREGEATTGDYTLAKLTETAKGERPSIERKS